MNWRTRTRLLAALVISGLAITGCGIGSDPLDTPDATEAVQPHHVAIGWVQAEQELIAEAYAGALRADGATTEVTGFADRGSLLEAMVAGEVDLVAEYSGELISFLDDEHPGVFDLPDGLTALPDLLDPELRVLNPAESGSRYVFAVPPAVTEQYDLVSLEDASSHLAGRSLGGPADFENAAYGPSGLAGLYGIEVEYAVVPDPDELLADLLAGRVQAAVFRSTDPRINSVVLLDDPQRMVPDNAIVPIVRSEIAEGHVTQTINDVQAALDEQGLLDLTADEQAPATDVAEQWLSDRSLN